MQELLNFVVKRIANHPDAIDIHTKEDPDNGTTIFQISSHSEDIALIIGKKGKVIKSIRNLLNVIALPKGIHVQLNVEEKESPESD
ncbi:KH domain-containing protein [Patescibacteria group bacterium]|nr:KH domain-containing protein [Patescibacteria group bacterium]MBU1868111.1 KH domain-containing protein [Patescibacteria group bacterium]